MPTPRISTPRTKKFRSHMHELGYKRVQKWVWDLDNKNIQKRLKSDLAKMKQTDEMEQWDEFTSCELDNIEGWE